MKKTLPNINDDELDLILVIKTIWDNKIKIILITMVSILIGYGYSYKIPNNYLNSLTINQTNSLELLEFKTFVEFLNASNSSKQSEIYEFSPTEVLNLFFDEINDYEEFLISIKNTKTFRETTLKLSNEDKEKKLLSYVNLFEIVKPTNKKKGNLVINFIWHDPEEANEILRNTLNLGIKNLELSIFENLDENLKMKRKIEVSKDKKRLDYLIEQSSIAKELDISNNQIDNFNLNQSSVSLSINTADIAYYLRGYKAIDKEIELIENRVYSNLKFPLEKIFLEKKEKVKWVNYNILLINVENLKNTKLISAISTLLGLAAALFYVFISNALKLKRSSKKSN